MQLAGVLVIALHVHAKTKIAPLDAFYKTGSKGPTMITEVEIHKLLSETNQFSDEWVLKWTHPNSQSSITKKVSTGTSIPKNANPSVLILRMCAKHPHQISQTDFSSRKF